MISAAVSSELLTPVQMFLWGFGGSIAVEVAMLNQAYLQPRGLPTRYKKFGFWIVRFLLATIAGFLAVGYGVNNPILAANIGASAPLILKTLAEGVKPASGLLPSRTEKRVGEVQPHRAPE